MTDQLDEKAIERARREGERTGEEAARQAARQERLEDAIEQLASSGPHAFHDPADALVFVEARIDRGDLDPDELYDGKDRVNTSALNKVLAGVLAAKPRLAAGATGESDTPGGGEDDDVEQHLEHIFPGHRRDRSRGKDPEHMSVDDHLDRIDPARRG